MLAAESLQLMGQSIQRASGEIEKELNTLKELKRRAVGQSRDAGLEIDPCGKHGQHEPEQTPRTGHALEGDGLGKRIDN